MNKTNEGGNVFCLYFDLDKTYHEDILTSYN